MSKRGCNIPKVCPIHLPRKKVKCCLIEEIQKKYDSHRVFVNISYSDSYERFEVAICTVLLAYGLTPVVVKYEYGSGNRFCGICECIATCRYGVSDIWRKTKNVPFELGYMLACGKGNIILHKDRIIAYKQLSDLQGIDPKGHEGKTTLLMEGLTKRIPKSLPGFSNKYVTTNQLRLIRRIVGSFQRRPDFRGYEEALPYIASYIRVLRRLGGF